MLKAEGLKSGKNSTAEFFLFLFILSLFISSCSVSAEEKNSAVEKPAPAEIKATDSTVIDTLSLGILLSPRKKYADWKNEALSKRKSLYAESQIHLTDTVPPQVKAAAFLEDAILNKFIPHWYRTPWDFSGYTAIPKTGVVACGYFVSTVLLHVGFNVDRYKLAQQNPFNEACSIALTDTVDIYSVSSRELQEIFNKNYTEGLYFAGLDFHVGFLLFRNKELYFIHSNYISSAGVMIEKAVYSDAFNASTSYRIAPLSTNEKLIEKWLKGEEIKVKTGK